MSNWRNNVRKVIPYVPGEQPNQPGMIKLNTNENPYPPAPGVQKVLEEFSADSLRLYPDPAVTDLVKALAKRYQVAEDQVFVGVGSDDVLAMAFMTFFNSDKPILFPDISYSFYSVWAEEFRIPYKRPALDENFRLVKEDYYQENGGIIFPNPNAPTGVFLYVQAAFLRALFVEDYRNPRNSTFFTGTKLAMPVHTYYNVREINILPGIALPAHFRGKRRYYDGTALSLFRTRPHRNQRQPYRPSARLRACRSC